MTEARHRTQLSCCAIACLALLLSSSTALAEAPPPSDSVTPASSSVSPAEGVRYRVIVDAPEPLKSTVAASVDLVRWQAYEDMTGGLFDALVRQAADQAKEAAETEGFFSASVDVGVDRATAPITVTVRVTPGPQTHVGVADIRVEGAAATDDEGRAAIERVRREWSLPAGAAFRQSLWESAKIDAVATLAGDGFAAAKLASSEAIVDADAALANLDVALDSGPLFRVGALDIQGLSRYTADLVERYRSQKPGDRYSIAELDQFVRRLNGTGYFASVHAAIDADPEKASNAPVHVGVIEAPPKKLEVGLGYSTDTAFRGNISYRDVDFQSRAVQFYADARVESKLQNAALRFVRPPAPSGWSQTTFGRVERTDISGLVTQTTVAGLRMSSLDERNQWQYGAAFHTDRQQPAGQAPDSSHALYVDIERAWRRVDDLAAPSRGYIALVQVGVGVPGASTRAFERIIARYAMWQPIGASWSFTARAEAGAVIAKARTDIPSALLFRTGGDTTVRGYAFDSLGIKQGDAILPTRYYYATSVELVRWIGDAWGVAGFVDAGDAFDQSSGQSTGASVAIGYGIGARVKTPIGPFRLDVAYGEASHQVRLHFSVGVTF